MRRDSRRREKKENNYNIFYIGGSILLIGILAFAITFVVYGNKMDKQASLDNEKIASLVRESANKTAQASTQMGKNVEESKNTVNTIENNDENKANTKNTLSSQTNATTKQANNNKTQNTVKQEETTTQKKETTKEALSFAKPVDGEIMKDYAKDKLLYSETLEEWTTHLGWDIKADKTTVVKASASRNYKIN